MKKELTGYQMASPRASAPLGSQLPVDSKGKKSRHPPLVSKKSSGTGLESGYTGSHAEKPGSLATGHEGE